MSKPTNQRRYRYAEDALDELLLGLEVVVDAELEGHTDGKHVAAAVNLMVQGAKAMAEPVDGEDG